MKNQTPQNHKLKKKKQQINKIISWMDFFLKTTLIN